MGKVLSSTGLHRGIWYLLRTFPTFVFIWLGTFQQASFFFISCFSAAVFALEVRFTTHRGPASLCGMNVCVYVCLQARKYDYGYTGTQHIQSEQTQAPQQQQQQQNKDIRTMRQGNKIKNKTLKIKKKKKKIWAFIPCPADVFIISSLAERCDFTNKQKHMSQAQSESQTQTQR